MSYAGRLTPIIWFTSLVVLPEIITGPGKYRTRCGEVVTITEAGGRAARFDCFGTYPNGVRERWHRSGRIHFSPECDNDIIERA